MSALRLRCVKALDGEAGWRVIRELPEEKDELVKWCHALGMEYRGQGVAGLALEVFTTLLKGCRKQPTIRQKKEVLARQMGKCALCGHLSEFPGQLEFDHQPPVRQILGDTEQHFRGLCRGCHAEVTESQGGTMRLESRFSRKAWTAYVESQRPPPFVFQPERPGQDIPVTLETDKVRCRKSALATPLCKEFPVFCALDSIVPAVTGQLSDFSFVASVRDKRLSALNLLPSVAQVGMRGPVPSFC